MGLPLKKVTEHADELEDALMPGYTEDELRGILAQLRNFAAIDPRRAFGHPVGEQRGMLERFDRLLCLLSYAGRHFVDDARHIPGLAREIQVASKEAFWKLRVCRALAAALAGEDAVADVEVRDAVAGILRERADGTGPQWSDEELRAFAADAPRASAEFETWLNES